MELDFDVFFQEVVAACQFSQPLQELYVQLLH